MKCPNCNSERIEDMELDVVTWMQCQDCFFEFGFSDDDAREHDRHPGPEFDDHDDDDDQI